MKHSDDAFAFLVQELRAGRAGDQPMRKFDLVADVAVSTYLAAYEQPFQRPASGWGRHAPTVERIWPLLMDAAYELCRRGVLRPGPRGEPDGGGVRGFVLTAFGKEWLAKSDHEALAITLPGRFEQLVSPYGSRFGKGFLARVLEAVKGYHAGLYLACCTMCGAASESILLQLAIAELGETAALGLYDRKGRNELKKEFLKNKTPWQRDGFERHFSILGYARDDAGHGKVSMLTEHDAFLAMLALFRLAQFSDKEF